MMVTFVSQCEKNALKKTRRVLDAFANRIGDNTWQTLITADGLQTVRKMLRKTASRSTAVSCHWIRSRSRSQLLWIVGNKSQFNSAGYVPVNRTEQGISDSYHENDWKYLPLIKSFAGLAGLLHDWGKASELFQSKINPKVKTKFRGDPLRHEWISSLLFCALVKSSKNPNCDSGWLDQLMGVGVIEKDLKISYSDQAKGVLSELPNAASLLVWLILSHHRLPVSQNTNLREVSNDSIQSMLNRISQQWGYENRQNEKEYQQRVKQCFEFPHGLMSASSKWKDQLSFWAKQLKENLALFEFSMVDNSWQVIAHHARLCLMVGDHFYSSQSEDLNWQTSIQLFANTVREDGIVRLKQKLDEHLFKVAEVATDIARRLPAFENGLASVTGLEKLEPKKDTPKKFLWQDKVVSAIKDYRQESQDSIKGYFVVNMASTGCGKTIANAKIMQALSDDGESLRYILALGLRTLTLQTGTEYRNRIGLNDSELAVLIGSQAVYELNAITGELQDKATQIEIFEKTGSESQEELLDETADLEWQDDWQSTLSEEELTTVLTRQKDKALLYAPVLVCTIDHIMTATETKRGGRYILPCLRLMSSDLVIDEVDDFVGKDLIAIGRLVYLAGMLGRKVMISSATIPPDLALGYFSAYQRGWLLHAKSRDINNQVGCVWVDEFKPQVVTISDSPQVAEHYQAQHHKFITKRVEELSKLAINRKAQIHSLSMDTEITNLQEYYFSQIQQAIVDKHQQNYFKDPKTGVRISFGVVRVANIQPCVALTQFLLEAEWQGAIDIRCMAYHSQQTLLLRHAQEQHLDNVLKRKEKPDELPTFLDDNVIRQHLEKATAKDLIFILVATPVEEVGRDHDFDWAVVEPSSYRSIIQLAGRVNRHRELPVSKPNVALLQYNWKGLKEKSTGNSTRVFEYPGYETDRQTWLSTHDLKELVDEKQLENAIDAIPRIQKNKDLNPAKNLADLEHFSTARTLGCQYLITSAESTPKRGRGWYSRTVYGYEQLWGYTSDCWWMTAMPQQCNPFRSGQPIVSIYLTVDEKQRLVFKQYDRESGWVMIEKQLDIQYLQLSEKAMQKLWLVRDYRHLLKEYTKPSFDLTQASQRYGEISLTVSENAYGYDYNDQLGLIKRKSG